MALSPEHSKGGWHGSILHEVQEAGWVKDPQEIVAKNGPPRMVKGTCSVCGTKVNKFLPTKRLDAVSTYDAM